jgi:PPM family protein phosphatase
MNTIKTFSASLTSVGRKRKNNEDSLSYYEPESPQEYLQSGNLYIVADGVGGAAKGERASRYAAEKVLYEYYQMPQVLPGERLRQLMREAGNQIYQYADGESFGRMATTMVAAVIKDDRLLVAHVGDSRAYLIRGGQVKQLTRDHSLVGEMIRDGTITEEESLSSKVKNRLTRSLGGEENVHVDVTAEIELEPGDRILLCTDGLTRYALPVNLLEMVPARSPKQAVQSLIDFANRQGGADNVTAIVISVHAQDEKVDWLAADYHYLTEPPIWEQETDENATTRYPAHLQSRLSNTKAFSSWIPLLIVTLLIVVVGVGMGLTWMLRPDIQIATSSPPTTLIPKTTQMEPSFLPKQIATQPMPILTVTPTLTDTPVVVPLPVIVLGECEYIVKSGDYLSKYTNKFGIGYSDVSCKPGSLKCPNGQLLDTALFPDMVLIFAKVDQTDCQNVGGTPIPPQ